MDVKQSVQNQFAAVADRYAESAVHLRGPDLDNLIEAADLDGQERVLDVGCGTGHTSLAIADRVAHVTALDLTPAMLDQGRRLARERGITNVDFEQGDAEDLPFPDRSFDRVTCRLCAHHFPHPKQAVKETARVLRPGGLLVLVDTFAPDDATQDTFLNCIELLRDPSHVRNHSLPQWLDFFAAAGLRGEVLGEHPMRLDFGSWFERMQTPEREAASVRSLFGGAPAEVQQAYRFDPEKRDAWSIPIALLRAERPLD